MSHFVYVLEIFDKNDSWGPRVYDSKEKAIDKSIEILTQWFPSRLDRKVTLEIYACEIF